MKLSTRAKSLYLAIVTAVVSLVVASPAMASEGATTTKAAEPDIAAILITGAVILVLVVGIATIVSNLLGKRG